MNETISNYRKADFGIQKTEADDGEYVRLEMMHTCPHCQGQFPLTSASPQPRGLAFNGLVYHSDCFVEAVRVWMAKKRLEKAKREQGHSGNHAGSQIIQQPIVKLPMSEAEAFEEVAKFLESEPGRMLIALGGSVQCFCGARMGTAEEVTSHVAAMRNYYHPSAAMVATCCSSTGTLIASGVFKIS